MRGFRWKKWDHLKQQSWSRRFIALKNIMCILITRPLIITTDDPNLKAYLKLVQLGKRKPTLSLAVGNDSNFTTMKILEKRFLPKTLHKPTIYIFYDFLRYSIVYSTFRLL